MYFRVLGGLEVVDGGRSVELGGRKQRAVLAALLLDAPRPVSLDRLIEILWGDDAPDRAEVSVQAYVSNLRRLLEPNRRPREEPALLVTRPAGYVLALARDASDASVFEDLVTEGQALRLQGHHSAAAEVLTRAVSMWAPVLPEFAGEAFVRESVARLESLHAVALEELFDTRLELGEHRALVPDLEAAVETYPLHERLWGDLALAHYRCGHQTEALRTIQRARRVLKEEVGLEPGPDLLHLEAEMLSHAPRLRPPEGTAATEAVDPRPGRPPAGSDRGIFVGRDRELQLLIEATTK
ncbi:MAG: AfsR/SARP family transcriptional regulator, partial [Actinomycetota bacterium]|nr:AfsR/SARP family transcriptional regulator [Actinomycetota bacterium]